MRAQCHASEMGLGRKKNGDNMGTRIQRAEDMGSKFKRIWPPFSIKIQQYLYNREMLYSE